MIILQHVLLALKHQINNPQMKQMSWKGGSPRNETFGASVDTKVPGTRVI